MNNQEANYLLSYIEKYYENNVDDENSRYKSWEYCHKYFINHKDNTNDDIIDTMCLHLGFYLASWGMLRGSSFLLNLSYKVHKEAIKIMLLPQFNNLWRITPQDLLKDSNIDLLFKCINKVTKAYEKQKNCKKPTETLITKIILGVYGCLPAYDRYFKKGLSKIGLPNKFNKSGIKKICEFSVLSKNILDKASEKINNQLYTEMKIIDMLFWQIGYDLENDKVDLSINLPIMKNSVSTAKEVKKNPNKKEVINYLMSKLATFKAQGKKTIEVRAGDLAKEVGSHNAIVTICNAMYEVASYYQNEIIHNVPSGYSTSVSIKYYLD